MNAQKITLYFKHGKTETITTKNPDKAKRVYGAESYILRQ